MNFIIISPSSKKIYPVMWIEINTPQGNYVIQPGHAPMIMSLSAKRPLAFGLENGKRESIMIQEGTISITRTDATLITNQDI